MATSFESKVKNILAQTGAVLTLEMRDELKGQGHVNTGKLLNSVKAGVHGSGDEINLDIEMNNYHVYLEHGVKASKIPYGGKRSGAKRSKYIEGLIKFFQSKGRSLKEAKSAAFATANVQSKEGMPTSGSYRFASNGRRLKFINESIRASKEIDLAENLILDALQIEGDLFLDDFQNAIR
jgi:hypothetical protein